jgi:hypothetical protein
MYLASSKFHLAGHVSSRSLRKSGSREESSGCVTLQLESESASSRT